MSPIIISPPLEYVGADWGRDPAPAEWHFPGTSRELLDAFLRSAGLAAEDVGRLQAAARPEPETQGLVIKPDREMVRRMAPEVRARLYLQLAKSSLNFDQTNAFRFYGTTSEDWFANALISPRTRAQIEPLLYREGDHLYFADADLIRSDVGDTEELRRLAKTLLRESTLLVRLAVENVAEVDTLVEYWGIGGRRTDLRPLLESVAGRGLDRSIDVIHLLPTFARNHLYRYPKLTTGDLIKPLLANCLWTALNFFRAEPDDRFLDVDEALRSLREDYYIVETDFRMGDIVGFTDERGNLFHVAVYLADDIVFSKNGMSQMAPWSLTTVDRLKSYYRSRSANPRLIFHRLNDF